MMADRPNPGAASGCKEGMGEIEASPMVGDTGGPPADFARWVAPHLSPMHLLAARLTAGAADDVVQDALVRAWRRRETFDPSRGSARTWLLALVAGEARRTRLRLRRRTYDVLPAPSNPDVERDLDVQRAVERLPRRMRLAVELYYFVGLPVVETAAVMGVSEGTAKSTLHDARERLRGVLDVRAGSEGN